MSENVREDSENQKKTIALENLPCAEWDDMYALGYSDIDNDHKELFKAINSYLEAVRSDAAPRITDDILEKMSDYAAEHFRREEDLMKRTFYKDYQHHKCCHDYFLDSVYKFRKRCQNGADISIDIAYFLPIWLRDHVLALDMNMGVYLRSYDTDHVISNND
ncbi:putative Hemerythrin-like metal-binding protein [Azospirillaceae bacterium]